MPTDWRRRGRAARFNHGAPLLRASSLPFAILFSTLGLLFLSLQKPPQHALVIDIPVSSGIGRAFEPWPRTLPTHVLRLTEWGEIWWDDDVVDQRLLLKRLAEIVATKPQPGLIFAPDGNASYDSAAKLLNIVSAAGIAFDRICLGDLKAYRNLGTRGETSRLMLSIPMSENESRPSIKPTEPSPCGSGNIPPA